ncbi:MAG: hypothetical protein EP329_08460, partial [Deltaproteobacteria bacterium]
MTERLRVLLMESFVPLLAVLVAILAVTVWVDGRADESAARYEIIRVSAVTESLASDSLAEGAAGAGVDDAAVDPAVETPIVREARELERAGELGRATETLTAAL